MSHEAFYWRRTSLHWQRKWDMNCNFLHCEHKQMSNVRRFNEFKWRSNWYTRIQTWWPPALRETNQRHCTVQDFRLQFHRQSPILHAVTVRTCDLAIVNPNSILNITFKATSLPCLCCIWGLGHWFSMKEHIKTPVRPSHLHGPLQITDL
jgi:hypothetical protein